MCVKGVRGQASGRRQTPDQMIYTPVGAVTPSLLYPSGVGTWHPNGRLRPAPTPVVYGIGSLGACGAILWPGMMDYLIPPCRIRQTDVSQYFRAVFV